MVGVLDRLLLSFCCVNTCIYTTKRVPLHQTRASMTSKTIRKRVLGFEEGKVFRMEDLKLSRTEQNAAVVALGRLVQEGAIERLSPGVYYKPKQTKFGIVGPALEERFKDLLYKNDIPIGYLTGLYAFNLLGLTTQQSTTLEIGTNFPGRRRRRGIYAIRFVLQKNMIPRENIELLRLLDCLKWIKIIHFKGEKKGRERLGASGGATGRICGSR